MYERGPCGKVPLTQTAAHDLVRRHRNTTHDRTIHAYHCEKCEAWHVGHWHHINDKPSKRYGKKWKRKRGGRRALRF